MIIKEKVIHPVYKRLGLDGDFYIRMHSFDFLVAGISFGRAANIADLLGIFGKYGISESSGIYILFDSGNLQYIGMSKNLRRRLLEHHSDPSKTFDYFIAKPFNDSISNILKLEQLMIGEFMPPLNKKISRGHNRRN